MCVWFCGLVGLSDMAQGCGYVQYTVVSSGAMAVAQRGGMSSAGCQLAVQRAHVRAELDSKVSISPVQEDKVFSPGRQSVASCCGRSLQAVGNICLRGCAPDNRPDCVRINE